MNIDRKDENNQRMTTAELIRPVIFMIGLFALLAVLSRVS